MNPPILQALQENQDKKLKGGEIAGIVLSLLLLAFVGGFVCAFVVVRRRRKELPDQEYTVTFDNVTYVIRALNPFQRNQNQSTRHLVLDSTISEPPPQYEEVDNQRNNAVCRPHYARQENYYDTADTVKKGLPSDGATCFKSVHNEKASPPPYEPSGDHKYNIYDVPDVALPPKAEQTYHEIPLPERSFESTGHYSEPVEGATGYETPSTIRENSDQNYMDMDIEYREEGQVPAGYNNELYGVSDA